MNFIDIGLEKDVFADGIHDDTSAIQSCLDRLKDGGTVYFPDGTYLISACLIFYSNQTLKFSDNAVLLRSAQTEEPARYLLASYSEPDIGGYDGTHNVIISGGIFDGNENLSGKITFFNTVHCNNITIKNCRFIHGAQWHYIELNSTSNALVSDCMFDGTSYTSVRNNLTSELIQIDAPAEGAYGPVYNYCGELIDFCKDGTPCSGIKIDSCIFNCGGFTAIGHHCNSAHNNVFITNNIFKGVAGNSENSRGYITFMELVDKVEISGNAFISTAGKNIQNMCIQIQNPDKSSCIVENNNFIGYFSEYFKGGITEKDNIIE